MGDGQRRVKERSAEMGKRFFGDTLILGMALFSMFFGAGNIIFPPYLGMESGSQWVAGFISYYMADIGLSVMAILALLKQRGRMEGVIGAIGRLPSKLMLSAMVLCIGPLIAVPRTGATTHEMFMTPIFGPMPPLVGSLIFFGVVFLLTIRESSVVDILGKFLTPALLLGLMVLILRGVISPMGEITPRRINTISPSSRAGVRNFPKISTTEDSRMVSRNTTPKKIRLPTRGGIGPKIGVINISWVVAPVRGTAISGPMHSTMADSISLEGRRPIAPMTPSIRPRCFSRARIAITDRPISAI